MHTGFEGVWKHLNSIHQNSPLHILSYGGDQIYSDSLFSDVPFLKGWVGLDFERKYEHEFSEEVSNQVRTSLSSEMLPRC